LLLVLMCLYRVNKAKGPKGRRLSVGFALPRNVVFSKTSNLELLSFSDGTWCASLSE